MKLLRDMEADAKKVYDQLNNIIQMYDATKDKEAMTDILIDSIKCAKRFADNVYIRIDAVQAMLYRGYTNKENS